MRIPCHIAIIMDGNGRWAKRRALPRTIGHRQGIKRVKEVVRWVKKAGVKSLTLFAFSTENWNRPKQEINMLFSYLKRFLRQDSKELIEEGVRLRVIGRKDRISRQLLEEIEQVKTESEKNDIFFLNIALDYGGRWDIVRAVREIAGRVSRGELSVEDIDETVFGGCIELADQAPPDLLIRTAGEFRISNFLLWQSAYSEFYFSPVYWPDFGRKELMLAMKEYSLRERKFGAISGEKVDLKQGGRSG